MATNTCMSVIEYQNPDDVWTNQPFYPEREAQAETMFNEGKTEFFPNTVEPSNANPGRRYWVDHAAAQEFIDFVLQLAPNYNVTITSTSIEDL